MALHKEHIRRQDYIRALSHVRDSLSFKQRMMEAEQKEDYLFILREMLAILCGDGGQYAEKYGLSGAATLAIGRHYNQTQEVSELNYLLKFTMNQLGWNPGLWIVPSHNCTQKAYDITSECSFCDDFNRALYIVNYS